MPTDAKYRVCLVLHCPGSGEDALVLDCEIGPNSSWLSGGHGFVGVTIPFKEGQTFEEALHMRDRVVGQEPDAWSDLCVSASRLTELLQE